MDNPVVIDEEVNLDMGSESLVLCRCCLSTENRMLDATKVAHYFMDLAGINVMSSDGLPLYICHECNALLHKAVQFKYKMLRAHNMLYQYITRCAPFSIDASDPELARYSTPQLAASLTLTFDTEKGKLGFHKVLQHEKPLKKSELDIIDIPCRMQAALVELQDINVQDGRVKEEMGQSDYEDNVPLEEFRSTANEILKELIESTEQIKTEPEVKKRKKKKEDKGKKRKKSDQETDNAPPQKKSIRKPIEIDPEKIKIIILNPHEQIKQREEESKASLKFPYQCNLCYKGFNFESKLQNHMSKHSPSRGPFECKLCHMFLPTSYSFTVHSIIHTRRYECLKCGRRMIDRASIYHHYRTEHEGIATVITCNICGKVSSNSKTHRGHMRNHHSGERPKCDQCGKSFVNKDSLAEHMQIHEGVKNYECSVCGKRCRTRAQIKHHQMKHSDVKDYYCVECDVRFKTAHSLRQHLQKSLKHQDVQSFKFSCSACPRRFACASLVRAHAAAAHGARRHACATCGAALRSRGALARHVARAHRAAAPPPPTHVCHTCGKAFRGKSVLTNHLRTHTGEKPFPCAACGRAFSQRTAMRTHLRRGHCKPAKAEPAAPAMFAVAKEESPLTIDVWGRPQEMFYVTAGP